MYQFRPDENHVFYLFAFFKFYLGVSYVQEQQNGSRILFVGSHHVPEGNSNHTKDNNSTLHP